MLITREQFIAGAEWIRSWKAPLLIAHVKPDVDALGAMLALSRLLAARGLAPLSVMFDPLPARYRGMHGFDTLRRLGADVHPPDLERADGIIVLDTCSYNQLLPLADWLRTTSKPKLVVDHHVTRDFNADRYLIDESAAATCLILFDWARAAGWPIDAETASALFAGVATDTGWFRHSNTDARVFAAAGELIGAGVRPHELFQTLYQRDTPARLRLWSAALETLELSAGGSVAVMTLPKSAFSRTGAVHSDSEDLVNEPLRIASVVVSCLLVEQEDSLIRVNLRSKPPCGCVVLPAEMQTGSPCHSSPMADIDVAALARTFQGGGHARAAGARVTGTLSEVKNALLERLIPLTQGIAPRG